MSKAKRKTKPRQPEIELAPDAWPKFERFIKDVAKKGLQHREAPTAKPKKKSK